MLISAIMTENVEECNTRRHAAARRNQNEGSSVSGHSPFASTAASWGWSRIATSPIRAVAEGRDPKTTRVRDIMSVELICCYEDQDVEVAAHLMQSQLIRRVLVLDRDKRLVGIVSLGDLAIEAKTPQCAREILQEVSGSAAMPA